MRFVLTFNAVVQTAMDIATARHGMEEGCDATDFLRLVEGEEGAQRCLLTAMMCDCGQHTLQLLRFFDSEGSDASEITAQLLDFIHVVDLLFVQKRVHTISGSCTQVMMVSLGTVRALVINGAPSTIGFPNGPTRKIIESCYAVMNAWVVMASSVLNAEYPSWDLIQSFSIFNTKAFPRDCATAHHLERLARRFRIRLSPLSEQYFYAKTLAVQFGGGSNWDVWRGAVQKQPGKMRELGVIIAHYGCFNGSTTSGVEHGHSTQERFMLEHLTLSRSRSVHSSASVHCAVRVSASASKWALSAC